MSNPYQKRLTDSQRKILHDFIKKNPDATWREFSVACKSVKISDAYYYMTRRDIHGPTKTKAGTRRKASPLYMTVWQYSTEKLESEARIMLQSLVESLSSHKNARWQLVELKDPAIIELRERSR